MLRGEGSRFCWLLVDWMRYEVSEVRKRERGTYNPESKSVKLCAQGSSKEETVALWLATWLQLSSMCKHIWWKDKLKDLQVKQDDIPYRDIRKIRRVELQLVRSVGEHPTDDNGMYSRDTIRRRWSIPRYARVP